MNLIILFGLLIFSIILAILLKKLPKNLEISEAYINDDNIGLKNFINNDIIEYSIKKIDINYENKLKNILLNKKNILIDIIKYTNDDNKLWSKWIKSDEYSNEKKLSEICNYFYHAMKQKLLSENIQILYYKLNKLKYNNDKLLLDNDFVFYKDRDTNAYHINIISIADLYSNNINILYIHMIGIINQDKINQYIYLSQNDKYSYVNLYNSFIDDNTSQYDSFNSLKSHDKDLENILYKKLKNDEIDNEDYKRNIIYTNNQNIVRKMFLENLNNDESDLNSKNKYKNYPYKEDFIIY